MNNPKLKTNGALNGAKKRGGEYEDVLQKPAPKEKTNGNRRKKSATGFDAHLNEQFDSRQLLKVLMEVKNGNFAVRMPIDEVGLNGKICDTLNDIIVFFDKRLC